MGHFARAKIIILPALTFCLLAVFFWRIFPPLSSTDSYFHLAVGKQVWQTKQIPKFDEFTFVAQNKAWISNEWLSGLIFYAFYHLASENGILILRALCGLLIASFLYLAFPKTSKTTRLAIILFVSLALSLRFFDRPEILSYLFFALEILLLERYLLSQSTKYLLPLPIVFLLWSNIQGYAPIGLVVFAFYIVVDFINIQGKIPGYFAARKPLLLTLTLTIIAAMATPGQFHRFLYFLFLNKDLFSLVAEVQSLPAKLASIKYNFWQNVPFELYIYLTTAAAGLFLIFYNFTKNKTLTTVQLLYFLFCIILGAKFFRAIPLAVLLVSPVLVKNLAMVKPATQITKALFLVFLLLIVIATIQKKPPLYSTNTLFVFDKQGQIFLASNSTWKQTKPTAALAFIKERYIPSKILTSLNWSNQVIWEFGGETKVAGDIIYEKQTKQSLADYQTLALGREGWQKPLSKYDPDIVINSLPLNLNELFEVPMWELNNWKLVYVDETAALYAKGSIENLPALTYLHPELEVKIKASEEKEAKAELEYLIKVNDKNSFAKEELIKLQMSTDPQSALTLARESIKIFPNNPNFYLFSATAKEKLGMCQQIALDLSRAKRLARGYYYLLREIDMLAASCKIVI